MKPPVLDRFDADVAIIGAGPAGCAAALTLANHTTLKVVMLERSGPQERPAEMLPPDAVKLLAYLQAPKDLLQAHHREVAHLTSAWGSEQLQSHSLLFAGRGRGWQIDRQQLEFQLRDLAESRGIAHLRAGLKKARRTQEGWRLITSQRTELSARFLIDASGRAAKIARKEGGHAHHADAMASVWRTYHQPYAKDSIPGGTTLIESVEHGWWYSSALPGNRIAVGFFADTAYIQSHFTNAPQAWNDCLQQTLHTLKRIGTPTAVSSLKTQPCDVRFFERSHSHDWVACGDAALTLDPLSSAGVSMGLVTGSQAARLAAAACAGQAIAHCDYSAQIHRIATDHLKERIAYYRQEGRWPASPFWQQRGGAHALAPESVSAAGGS
ncbi:MAG: tryptophan 7-halogenase [Pseudomonadota bacterium]